VEFVYLKIPESADAPLREQRLHAALEAALAGQHLGGLLGWGASIENAGRGPRWKTAFHRIDIEVADLPTALAVLKSSLASLDTPRGTELHYTLHGRPLQEEYGPDGWSASHPTTATTSHRARPGPAD
jgi:hypothetical protein